MDWIAGLVAGGLLIAGIATLFEKENSENTRKGGAALIAISMFITFVHVAEDADLPSLLLLAIILFFGWLWVSEEIDEERYSKQRKIKRERERKREEMEQVERNMRMQAEEAERQRRHEREKAQQDRAEREARERAKSDNNQRENQREAKADTNKNPYEVLNVSKSASFEDIQKVYRNLASKNHPDKVRHLGPEIHAMANEKFTEINVAFKKIKKERGR